MCFSVGWAAVCTREHRNSGVTYHNTDLDYRSIWDPSVRPGRCKSVRSFAFFTTTMPDPTTQSNYLKIVSHEVHIDWNVDFEKRVISGSILHDLIVKEDDVAEVM